MDRRSGLKKAHFSSVPTRMSLFTCKKYVFLIEKNFPNLTTPPKNRENSAHALYESRWKTQHNALYESRWKTQHNALYESRWKTQHNALYESRCGLVMLQIGLHLTIYKLSNSSNLVKFS
ncbi:hypothetical protein LEP1GSC151_5747 [Leptospira interrogans serovar Grippotyphosa str. LT2186]|uniref:Uncharacterized protein n=1 Tax=Leptospira interrogans serovar Grippotyphosa str. LT2186 TaxID=1001599 RepID=M3I190_LEPIR|nr:hypothetical protein LEP1GSC151_5747 [Leptospira interrogans serovar Grippotyphosa str. LT2186]EMN84932.1 hypothetical protein LEP1GSC107_3275 [Leptospira interrogans serovar Grippotyphosa str. UI 12769]